MLLDQISIETIVTKQGFTGTFVMTDWLSSANIVGSGPVPGVGDPGGTELSTPLAVRFHNNDNDFIYIHVDHNLMRSVIG